MKDEKGNNSSRLKDKSIKPIKKNKRGRPVGSKNDPDKALLTQIAKKNGQSKDSLFDFKGKMTTKELNFLEFHVAGFRVIKAMVMAGFVTGSNTYKYLLAKKIIEKYERQAEDHRNIFRAIGLGELTVARGILRCCQTAKTEKGKREAWALAAKCLGLQRDVIEGGAIGIQIIMGVAPALPGTDQQQGEEVIDLLPQPIKTLSITK